MPVNMGEAIPAQAENRRFHLAPHPTEIIRTVKIDGDLAPLRKPIGILAER
jgi:hypothetical protein